MGQELHFESPTEVAARHEDGRIIPDVPPSQLQERILDGEVFILKDVFDPDNLCELREAIFEWGLRTEEEEIYMLDVDRSFHRRDRNPSPTKHPRLFHHYCFYDVLKDEAVDELAHQLIRPYLRAIRSLHGELTGTECDLDFYPSSSHYHPQVFHYPSGGGYFSLHKHEFQPNTIGILLSLSERGENFERGGTRFQHEQTTIDIEGHHGIGDIALFRYDLVHSVFPVDPTNDLDWGSDHGKWSLIMPYHPRVWEGEEDA